MMAPRDQASELNPAGSAARACRRPHKTPILALAGSRATRGSLSTLAMAFGYLGLVAILTMAPFVQQAITPHQGQPLVCTDFGGSR